MKLEIWQLVTEIALALVTGIGGDFVGAKFQTPRPHDPTDPVDYPDDYCKRINKNEQFDFIVIGAGPAGATIARRLAENPHHRVLLVEAGHDPPAWTDISGLHLPFSLLPRPVPSLLWNVETIPSDMCRMFSVSGRCYYNLAKVLGGCSVINAMMYIRGNKEDYNEWRDQGCPGWGYEDLLPYFRKLEDYKNNITTPEFDKYHGQGGPMTAAEWPIDPASANIRENFQDTVNEMGYPLNLDFNGASQIGFGTIPGMAEVNGYRCSAAKAYLLHIPDNLKVCKRALATRLKLSADKKVEGVYVTYTGGLLPKNLFLRAKKDYIITAGPINSPLLLERSGIGQCEVLRRAGITCLHELRGVGENFQDQFANFACGFLLGQSNTTPRNWLTNDLTSFTGFLNTTDNDNPIPDVQFYLGLLTLSLGDKAERLREALNIPDNVNYLTVAPAVLRQGQRGSVHISSANPLSSPILDAKQFSTPEEIRANGYSCRLARKIMANKRMAKYKPKPLIVPQCLALGRNSDSEIMCGARNLGLSLYHIAGTLKMGPKSDTMSVVDTRLRVHGIPNLRIGDLSVMPDVPRGNTEIPTIAVAEKVADVIKDDYK